MLGKEERFERIKECKTYIDLHLNEDLDIKKLAKQFGYPYPTFRKYFEMISNSSPYAFVKLRRIQDAAMFLRMGGKVTKAAERAGYETLTGFNRAFYKIYGITSSAFVAQRGRQLMRPPAIETIPGFHLVGYTFRKRPDFPERLMGAYWIYCTFPQVSTEEFARIGGGVESVAIWTELEGEPCYILGSVVEEPRYVPAVMNAAYIPGGLFAAFPVPQAPNNDILSENIRVTQFFACHQWLPESGYEVDDARTSFEFYLNNDNKVYVPIREKGNQQRLEPDSAG